MVSIFANQSKGRGIESRLQHLDFFVYIQHLKYFYNFNILVWRYKKLQRFKKMATLFHIFTLQMKQHQKRVTRRSKTTPLIMGWPHRTAQSNCKLQEVMVINLARLARAGNQLQISLSRDRLLEHVRSGVINTVWLYLYDKLFHLLHTFFITPQQVHAGLSARSQICLDFATEGSFANSVVCSKIGLQSYV